MKKIIVSSLVSLFFLSCSISVPNNSLKIRDNFADLEKEYYSFSTKALSDGYVKRMFTKYIGEPNTTQLTRQLEFSRYLKNKGDTGYESSLRTMFSETPALYNNLTGITAISQKIGSESATFGTFVNELSPLPVATSATNIGSTSFTANWNSLSGATGYKLYVDSNIAIDLGIVTSYSVTGLAGGSTHSYYVKAVKTSGTSNSSNTISVKTAPDGMVLAQGGTFTMGDEYGDGQSNELPLHQVTLSNFYIAKYEVTQKEYLTLIGSNPGTNTTGDDYPVNNVSWWDSIKYCNKLSISAGLPVAYNESTGALLDSSGNVTTDTTQVSGFRLATEAEWEYSAKGGNQPSFCEATNPGKRCKASGTSDLGEAELGTIAWWGHNSGYVSHIVGTKNANELGIYDMTGNAAEWVTDYWSSYSSGSFTNPYVSTGTNRVRRGGSWCDSNVNQRSAFRTTQLPPGTENITLGFRIVKSAN